MFFFEHKPILKKDISNLEFNNHEKQLIKHFSFHKNFTKKRSTKKQKTKNKNENLYLISLLRNKIFTKEEKKLYDIQMNYNSFNPYVTQMMANTAKLVKYNHTKYMLKEIITPKNIDEDDLNNSNNTPELKIKKSFFGLDSKSQLKLENDLKSTSPNNLKSLLKSPSSVLTYTKDENFIINKDELYTKEDDIFANKIFNKTYYNKNENNNNKENEKDNKNDNKNDNTSKNINIFFDKYSIEKNLTDEEKMKIKKTINNSRLINKRNCFITSFPSLDLYDSPKNEIFTKTHTVIRDYENPYHSLENLKINSQLKKTVGKIRDNLQYKRFQEQFKTICDLKISNKRMPNIKALNKQNLIKKVELLKNKNVINYFREHKNNMLNKRKIKDINVIKKNYDDIRNHQNNNNNNINNNHDEENDKLSYEERLKRVQIEIWHLESGYHPESRVMSSICFNFEENKLYNYGGLGGIFYGDIWECKFDENDICWQRIYAYEYDKIDKIKENNNHNYNVPLPRYGHTCHYYKKKMFLIGGEFKDWEKNLINEELLWIYDIEKKEWSNLHKYEIKNKIIFDRRSSKNLPLYKLKKNFSDILLKIPLLMSENYDSTKNHRNKTINKSLFTKNKIEDKKIYKKLRPNIRRNHISLLIGTHIFIYGGISANKEILNDCWIYDLKLCQWENIQSIGRSPPPLAHHCSCLALEKDLLINDTFNIYHKPKNIRGTVDLLKMDGVFFFGGINSNQMPSNLFFHMTIGIKPVIFDTPNIDGKPPNPRIDASMDFAQNISMIIIYGGKNEFEFPSYYGDMFLLDLRIMNWIHPSFVKEKPIKRAQHLSIIIGDELIIFGGTNGNEILNYDFTVVDLNFF